MLSTVLSTSVYGVDAFIVSVETDIAQGLPAFTIVGLPDAAVKESQHRVQAAVKNSGFAFPNRRITVNLAPADIRAILASRIRTARVPTAPACGLFLWKVWY